MVDLSPNKKKVYNLILFIFLKSFIASFVGMGDILNMLVDVCVIYFAYKTPNTYIKIFKNLIGEKFLMSVYVFYFVGLLADIINLVPIPTVIWGIRMFCRYLLLLYLVIATFDISDIDLFRKLLYKLFWWNLLACLYQLFTFRTGDAMEGIVHGNGELAILLVVFSVFFSMEYFVNHIDINVLLIRFSICLLIAIWAEIKLLYFILPFSLYMCYVLAKKTNIIHVVILILASVFFIPSMKYILSFYYDDNYIEDTFDSDRIIDETSHEGYNLAAQGQSFNRNICIKKTQELFFFDPIHRTIGWGIGSGTNSSRFRTWINTQYEYTAYFFFTSSYVLIETGWIGYISFLLIYSFLLLRLLGVYKKSKNAIVKYWTCIGISLCFMTYIFIWYNDAPYANYYIPFIIWGFCFVVIRNK